MIEARWKARGEDVGRAIEALLDRDATSVEPKLLEAMRYACVDGGKRIRPVLVLAAAEAAGGTSSSVLDAACAVEMIHTYSLIHDDLPAMDDDPVRRGKPSSHVAFGEAIAILAGDALLTEAFVVLGRGAPGVSAERSLRAVAELAVAAGAAGMVGGQVGDVLGEGEDLSLEAIESIHRRKTGALLRASVRIGAILGGADEAALAALTRYGEAVGLAFQVADDLLDATGNLAATGKVGPRDAERGKSTIPGRLGIDGARRRLVELGDACNQALEPLGSRAEELRGIAAVVVQRALGDAPEAPRPTP